MKSKRQNENLKIQTGIKGFHNVSCLRIMVNIPVSSLVMGQVIVFGYLRVRPLIKLRTIGRKYFICGRTNNRLCSRTTREFTMRCLCWNF